jgi:hypothetical protein
MLSRVILSVVNTKVTMLDVAMQSVILLNRVMLSAFITECHTYM